MCDDPDCPHSGVRRAWDSVGRFFGMWGEGKPESSDKGGIPAIVAGPIILDALGDAAVQALHNSESFVRSMEGTSTVDEDLIQSINIGFKFTSDYRGSSIEQQFGIYSTEENSIGFYKTTTLNIGVKGSSDSAKGFLPMNPASFTKVSFFGNANTSNIFDKDTVSNDTKFKINGSAQTPAPFSLTSSYERSLKTGKTNKAYGFEGGIGKPVKVEGSVTNSTTILVKSKQMSVNGSY